jgi:hypothetical protein
MLQIYPAMSGIGYSVSEVPPEPEFFGNIENPGTRRVYKDCVRNFMRFFGISRPAEYR